MKIFLQVIFLFLGSVFSASLLADAECKGTYDPETGIAKLPCVEEIKSGNWYFVNLGKQDDLNFSVTQAEKMDLSPEGIKIVNSKVIDSKTPVSQKDSTLPWLYLELSVEGCGPGVKEFRHIFQPTPETEGRGRIDVKIGRISSCDDFPPLVINLPYMVAGVVRVVGPGTYDIYVNGELKASVEVPGPGS